MSTVVAALRHYTLQKIDYNGKGVGSGSVLRNLIREATTRGMCVLERVGIIALGVFGQGSTQVVLRPVAHSSGRHHGEGILRCHAGSGSRTPAP